MSTRPMVFEHIASGDQIVTHNMCFALYPTLYKFIGYGTEALK